MMAVLNVWMFILITLNSWKWASGCTWMKTHNEAFLSNFQVLSKNSIVHLQHACRGVVHDHGHLNMEFPNTLYNLITQLQAKDHILFILQTLKSVMRIYRRKYKKMDCNQHKLQIFLLDVDRQILELEQCATYIVAGEVHKRVFMEMEIHFRSLMSHLKNTKYSAQSCNDVAEVTLRHLRRLDLLAAKTKTDSEFI
ncbi:interferon a3-like isoform X3 [Neoarius graeffei]|uniref:interferon a3-like isoform X3 n=1 Tax=Neoarius graeffei TaxID=443677 RepID=UPI00298C0BEC|nr:interferon a3-like isoform X3 [Neoarius graeffei]